jgi:hypothetical protein
MSLLSSFLVNQLVKELEAQFVAHEPQLQQVFLSEVSTAVDALVSWVLSKTQKQSVEAPK